MSKCIHIIESGGAPFTMRLVEKGDRYGKGMGLIHQDDDQLIEFYDRRFSCEDDLSNDVILGQFVMRCQLSSFMDANPEAKTTAMRSCFHALMAIGAIPAPEGRKAGWILVMDEPPMVGLNPHPSYAPDVQGWSLHESGKVDAWAQAYHLHSSLLSAEVEISEDFAARQDAFDEEYISDMGPEDVAAPVFVTEDGAIEFLDFHTGDVFARHEMKDIFQRGFGMPVPEIEDRGPQP